MEIELDGLRAATWPLGIIVLVVVLLVLWRRKHSPSHLLCSAVFGIYLLSVIHLVFFPIAISGSFAEAARQAEPRYFSPINLIPFNFDFSELPDHVLREIFLNVLVTVPFSFGISFVTRVRARDFLWLALAVGFGLEAVQLIISLLLGYFYRIIDINDAIMNTLGVLIGYAIFRGFAWLYMWVAQRHRYRSWRAGRHAAVDALALAGWGI